MDLRQKIRLVTRGRFVRSAGMLVGGTAAAQGLMVLALPLLTRLYSPSDFSLLAIYIAIQSIISVIACLRLDIAIPIPENDQEGAELLVLALLFAFFTGCVVAAAVWMLSDRLAKFLGEPWFADHAWLLPIGIWLAASYSALQYWATRKKRFKQIAQTRFAQASTGLTAQLGMGWLQFGPIGLIFGQVLIGGAGVFSLSRSFMKNERALLRNISVDSLRNTIRRYRRFPIYSTWEALFNNAGIQLPVLLIASLAVGPEAGFLLLATRILGAPVALVGSAIGQVYLSEAAHAWKSGSLLLKTQKVTKALALLLAAPIILISAVISPFFDIIFGPEWQRAGEVLLWLAPMFAVRAMASPISMVMNVVGRQRQAMLIKLFGFSLRIVAIYIANAIGWPLVEAYAIVGAGTYLLFLVVFLRAAKTPHLIRPRVKPSDA